MNDLDGKSPRTKLAPFVKCDQCDDSFDSIVLVRPYSEEFISESLTIRRATVEFGDQYARSR